MCFTSTSALSDELCSGVLPWQPHQTAGVPALPWVLYMLVVLRAACVYKGPKSRTRNSSNRDGKSPLTSHPADHVAPPLGPQVGQGGTPWLLGECQRVSAMSVNSQSLRHTEIQVVLPWDLYQDFKVAPAPGLSRILCVWSKEGEEYV